MTVRSLQKVVRDVDWVMFNPDQYPQMPKLSTWTFSMDHLSLSPKSLCPTQQNVVCMTSMKWGHQNMLS